MLSIPRDTRTEIIGHNSVDKINHAYAFGGVPMAVNTVEHFLDIPIDYYVFINMEGFLQIIDTIGGVTIDNDMDLTYNSYHYPKGEITLDGDKALIFHVFVMKIPVVILVVKSDNVKLLKRF